MKYYAGLDVSMKETFICVMDSEGKILHENMTTTEPEFIASYLCSLKLEFELVGLESGSFSHWLTDELRSMKLPVICVDARHLSAFLSMNINKTDKNDARGIANALRCKIYKEVSIKTSDDIATCTLLNSRKLLVNQRVQLIGTVRGLLKPFGIKLGSLSKRKKCLENLRFALRQIPECAGTSIYELLNVLEKVFDSIESLENQVKAQIQESPQAQVLMTIPGVGPLTALRFLADITDPKRFKKSKSVGAYIGLTPRQYSSGETEKRGKISKCGPKELRTLLVEAGLVILTRTKSWSKLKAWGMKIQKKHGLKKAATAVGRKLGVIMHRMLITGETFRFTDKEVMRAAA